MVTLHEDWRLAQAAAIVTRLYLSSVGPRNRPPLGMHYYLSKYPDISVAACWHDFRSFCRVFFGLRGEWLYTKLTAAGLKSGHDRYYVHTFEEDHLATGDIFLPGANKSYRHQCGCEEAE